MSSGMFELPEWAHEIFQSFGNYPRTARGIDPKSGGRVEFVYCQMCAGWVKGRPVEREENSISIRHPLSGKRGISYLCPVCEWVLGFDGAVA